MKLCKSLHLKLACNFVAFEIKSSQSGAPFYKEKQSIIMHTRFLILFINVYIALILIFIALVKQQSGPIHW